MKVVITGAGGNAGQAVSRLVAEAGYELRMADMVSPVLEVAALGGFVRCDARMPTDVQRAVEGAVVHLAAWHSAHRPPISDATIFAVNVDGTFNVLQACHAVGVGAVVFASSMAYGWGGVYSVTKVVGEELCRAHHEMTGAAVAMCATTSSSPHRTWSMARACCATASTAPTWLRRHWPPCARRSSAKSNCFAPSCTQITVCRRR